MSEPLLGQQALHAAADIVRDGGAVLATFLRSRGLPWAVVAELELEAVALIGRHLEAKGIVEVSAPTVVFHDGRDLPTGTKPAG